MTINNKLGLEESEAKVYLALLELGPATVSEITRKAGITRTLGYHVLDKLSWRGLVDRAADSGSKIVFSALHPTHLLQYVRSKQEGWGHKLSELEEILPELTALFRSADKPTVHYQEGAAGIKNIYAETLNSKTEILSIMDVDNWNTPEFKNWGKAYNRKRSEAKIHERILMLDTPIAREWMKDYRGSFKYTDYRWIKPEQLPGSRDFGGEINIFENKVMIAIPKKPHRMGMLVENTSLANILKAMFELAWTQGVAIAGHQPKKFTNKKST